MKITILTLFPEMFAGYIDTSILKRAIFKKAIEVEIVNIRYFTKDRYGRTDTPPIGGGAGLVFKCQPLVDAIESVSTPTSHICLFSPRGKTFDQNKAKEFSKMDHLILVCGHYEGIDERVNSYVDELISIGDYILTGGEIPAMAVTDAVMRLLDGAIASFSLEDESFNEPCLEYPQYTEPYDFRGSVVPDILYSGNHEAIRKWRRKQSLLLTRKYRPDLFKKLDLSKEDKRLLNEADENMIPKWETDALEKGHRFIKK